MRWVYGQKYLSGTSWKRRFYLCFNPSKTHLHEKHRLYFEMLQRKFNRFIKISRGAGIWH